MFIYSSNGQVIYDFKKNGDTIKNDKISNKKKEIRIKLEKFKKFFLN